MTTQLNGSSQRSNTNVVEADRKHEHSRTANTVKKIPSDVLNGDMTQTKQCISCNREMPISSQSCVCGHVLSDIKSLEGKRYSGYREELYSRLEIRRILGDHEKPKRPRLKQKSLLVKPMNNILHKPQMKRRQKRKSPAHLSMQARHQNTYRTEQSDVKDNPDLCYYNPRFNFKDALADINKRLTSQTSFWISL